MNNEQDHDGLLHAALAFEAAGCSVVPARTDGSKAPAAFWKTYQTQRPTPAELTTWLSDGAHDGIGLICGPVSGGLEMLELEGRAIAHQLDVQLAAALTDHGLEDLWHRIVAGYLEVTPSGGIHILYRVEGEPRGNRKLASRPAAAEELADAERAVLGRHPDRIFPRVLIETRGQGGYVIVAPSAGRTHPSGQSWALMRGGPASIVTISEDERDALHAIASLLDQMPDQPIAAPASGDPASHEAEGGRPGDDYNTTIDWTDILTPLGWRHTRTFGKARGWCRPGKPGPHVSATTGRTPADNLYVFSSSTEFDTEKPYSKFAAYALLHHGGDYAAAASALRAQGYGRTTPTRHDDEDLESLIAPVHRTEGNLATITPLPTSRPQLQIIERTLPRSEDANALALVDRYGDTIRYCPDRGRWLTWDTNRWQWCEPGGGIIREHARHIARALPADQADDRRFKASSLSNRGIGAAVQLAQTDERVVVPAADLDAAPMALNTPHGIINLTTGTLTPPDPAGLHTRLTAVPADPHMPTPRWDAFLAETFGGDTEMIGFVQRLAGYSASADVRHHILPFLHGAGQNGKSVLMDVLRHLLGDYATTAPPGFLMESRQEHSAEVARLQGLRLVVASEVNQNARFDEAKLKELTGGDTLTARFMRQDFFTFQPTHHLWLMANHKPTVRAGGDSFWRRVRLIPFNHRVPDEKKIENLSTLLAGEEGPGILAWVIRGAVNAFANGLAEPESVLKETRSYAEEEDQLGRFLEDCCHLGGAPQVRMETKKLRAAYEAWCVGEGVRPLPASPFGRELKARGIDSEKSNSKRWYLGVALINQETEDHWSDR